MIKKLVILHEYGAPRHFEALYRLYEEGKIARIEPIEFNIPKQFAKGILYRDIKWVKNGFRNMRKVSGVLKRKGQTIIIGAAPYDAIIPLLLHLKKRNKVIYFTSWPYWDGDRYPKRVLYPYQRALWHKFIDGIMTVTVSKAAQEAISKLGAKAMHIPHSVDTKLLRPRRVESDDSKVRVLFVGQVAWHKGVDLLLDIVKDKLWKNVEYWFVGEGPLSNELLRLARSGYPIEYFGYVSDRSRLAEIYRSADIFVLPSRQSGKWEELFGIALIEAMASGLPVIATDCVGPKKIINDAKNGFIVPQDSKSALIDKLGQLIESPQTRSIMGEYGRNKAKVQFDIAVNARRWEKVLKETSGYK